MPHLWPLFRNARLVHWGGRVELAERAHVDVHRLAPGGARGVRAPPEAVNEEARRHPRVAHVQVDVLQKQQAAHDAHRIIDK